MKLSHEMHVVAAACAPNNVQNSTPDDPSQQFRRPRGNGLIAAILYSSARVSAVLKVKDDEEEIEQEKEGEA
jgi:hypothetical protein